MTGMYIAMVIRILGNGGSIASIVALLLFFAPSGAPLPRWAYFAILSSVALTIYLIFVEIRSSRKLRSYKLADSHGINAYMREWIGHGGRVAIWTRDMSWAEDPQVRQLLLSKARAAELVLCLPTETALTNELKEAGAEVCAYGIDVMESPTSRFTITQYGRDGSQVAIGHRVDHNHVIHEFDSRKDPAFHVARDLVDFARKSLAGRSL